MNILVEESVLAHIVRNNLVVETIEFGSGGKGTKTEQSDTDLLILVRQPTVWARSPFYSHHLLQYKNEDMNIDNIICTVPSFVKGLIDGDSTVFIEILRGGFLYDTKLDYLHKNMTKFSTYRMARALLGTAERDIKECSKLFSKDPRKSVKKYKFALDGLYMALDVMAERWPESHITRSPYIPSAPDTRPAEYTRMQAACLQIQSMILKLRQVLNTRNEVDQAHKVPWIDPAFAKDLAIWTSQSDFSTEIDFALDIIVDRACNFE